MHNTRLQFCLKICYFSFQTTLTSRLQLINFFLQRMNLFYLIHQPRTIISLTSHIYHNYRANAQVLLKVLLQLQQHHYLVFSFTSVFSARPYLPESGTLAAHPSLSDGIQLGLASSYNFEGLPTWQSNRVTLTHTSTMYFTAQKIL